MHYYSSLLQEAYLVLLFDDLKQKYYQDADTTMELCVNNGWTEKYRGFVQAG